MTRLPALEKHAPALISTLHDPDGIYLRAIATRGFALSWYRGVYICATESTHPGVRRALGELGAVVRLRPERDPGAARRESLELAMADGHQTFHYCDFDRWLHWVGRSPDELERMPATAALRHPRPWYVCFGRDMRAFATHPEVQQLAERATSRALELVIGRRIDATAGSCWLSVEGARIVTKYSVERTMGTDLEWPALVWRHDPERLRMIRTTGLEFESAEFAPVADHGDVAAWIEATYQRPEMWQMRFQLAADSIAALNRVLQMDLDTGAAFA